ncbi:MAG TPA: hypothetical protein VF556_11210 [Pyrinomonadaceae bacterium]
MSETFAVWWFFSIFLALSKTAGKKPQQPNASPLVCFKENAELPVSALSQCLFALASGQDSVCALTSIVPQQNRKTKPLSQTTSRLDMIFFGFCCENKDVTIDKLPEKAFSVELSEY